jgi:hypothetical protein
MYLREAQNCFFLKHKIVSSRSFERLDFGSGPKEAVMPQREGYCARNFKIHSNQ